jgi:DNA-binding NarL/FixJ family response regulator
MPNSTPTLLIVDDNEEARRAIRKIVVGFGDVLGEAHDCKHAVEEAARLRPDIVLLDISLPDVNGLEAARRIKRHSPNIRIIFVSQNTDPAYKDAMVKIGADAFVWKSTAAKDLPPVLQDLMRRSQTGREFAETSETQTSNWT